MANPYLKQSKPKAGPTFSAETLTNIKRWEDFSSETSDADNSLLPPPPASAEHMIEAALHSLKTKELRNGYASYLMDHEYMHHWIHIAREDQHLWSWFQSFLNDTLVGSISEEFDVACGLIMNRLMDFGKDVEQSKLIKVF